MNDLFFQTAFDRTQNWYNVLAEQRIKLMNFYVLIFLGSATSIGVASNSSNHIFLLMIGFATIFFATTFKLLDRRTASMIKIAELALRKIEDRLAEEFSLPELRFIEAHDQISEFFTYRKLLNIVYFFGFLLGAFSLALGVIGLCDCF